MKNSSIKVVFFGTSDFAVPILNIIKNNFSLLAVVTQPDRQMPSPVSLAAQEVELLKPDNIKDEEFVNYLKKFNVDVFVVAAYGNIIPKSILDIPKFGCLNLHGSILPKYRGSSPIQETLKNGDKISGVTMILMDEKMDHGPVIGFEQLIVETGDNFKTLESKLAKLAADLTLQLLPPYLNGEIKPEVQDENKATYVKIINKEDGLIDWNKSCQDIYNLSRAYSQWPGIYTQYKGKRFRLDQVSCTDEPSNNTPGALKMSSGKLFASTGTNYLEILRITPESKKTLDAKAFINGYSLIDKFD